MTMNVSVPASSVWLRPGEQQPDAPHTSPETNQAEASTSRTGTPSVAVISRSLASARIAVPSFV